MNVRTKSVWQRGFDENYDEKYLSKIRIKCMTVNVKVAKITIFFSQYLVKFKLYLLSKF